VRVYPVVPIEERSRFSRIGERARARLAVRVGRVESLPFREQLRAPTGAGAPRSAREARALPWEIIRMEMAYGFLSRK